MKIKKSEKENEIDSHEKNTGYFLNAHLKNFL